MSGVNCRGFDGALVDLARGGPCTAILSEHLEACDECGMALDRQMRLSAAARTLAAEADRLTAPLKVEQALLAEMESTRGNRRRLIYGAMGGAIAASLAVFWWMASRPAPKIALAESVPVVTVASAVPQPVTEKAHSQRRKRAAQAAVTPEQPFIAIPYTLPLEPYERADVMRMDLPVSALIAAGLPMSMMDPGALVRTDVLVGQDGRARAIRLISFSTANEMGSNEK
jgi:uncharacterized protein